MKAQLNYRVSFRIPHLVWIHKQNAMRMPENQDTNMHFIWKNSISVYRFKALDVVILIQEPSLMSQEGDGMNFLPWKALQVCFQFWNFFEKMQTWFCIYGAAGSPFARGLACLYMYEWFRLRKLIKESLNWWYNIWFFMLLFSNLFHAILDSIISNHHNSFHIWLYTKS